PWYILRDFFGYTVWWAIINLLPILPLDGGHVVEAVLEWIRREPQKQLTRLISGVVGITLGLLALLWGNPFLMLGLVLLGVLNLLPWYAEQNSMPVRVALRDEDSAADCGAGEANVVSMDKARKK